MRIDAFLAEHYFISLNRQDLTKTQREGIYKQLTEYAQIIKNDFIKKLRLYDNSDNMNALLAKYEDKIMDLQVFLMNHKEEFIAGSISEQTLNKYSTYKECIQNLCKNTDKFAAYNERYSGFYHIVIVLNPWSELRNAARSIPMSFIE